jgi:hypothetical protein
MNDYEQEADTRYVSSSCKFMNRVNVVYNNSITEESPRVTTPPNIRIPLRPHQAAIVARMHSLERDLREGLNVSIGEKFFSRFAILGDAVGTGKSLCVLAYLSHIKHNGEPTLINPSYCHSASTPTVFSLISVPTRQNAPSTNLLIVPHTLYRQWMDYCTQQTDLNVFYCKTKRSIIDPIATRDAILTSDLTLVSNNLYTEVQQLCETYGIIWDRCFIDEVDTIHIPSTRPSINARFTWFITATWISLLKSNLYLINYDITQFLAYSHTIHPDLRDFLTNCSHRDRPMMGTWHSLNFFKQYFTTHPQRVQTVIRVEDRFRKMSISAPPIYNSTIICRAPRHAALVNELVSPEIQMALNADDMETVFTHLGINKTTTDSLLEAVTCMQQKELQRLKSILLFKSSLDYSTPQAKEEAIKTLEAKITKITDQINTLRKRMNENKVCYICFEDISGKEMVVPCCHNVFCPKCILTSMTYRPTCPFCRANINPSALTYIGSGIQLAAVDDGPVLLTKTEQLLHLLVSQPDSKFIVFSRYDNPFLSIKNKLEEHNISVTIVNGNKDHIHNIQMKFRDGEFRVLLLNSTNFCSGMNLESATHVILYHSGMSYTEEEQVIGRAYRMGRTMPLHVVRLMNEGE